MESLVRYAPDGAVVLMLFVGVTLFRSPRSARVGNWLAALALAAAIVLVLVRNPTGALAFLVAALVLGGVLGLIAAYRVTMLQIPAMVAFQHGAGGVAAFLISFVELWRGGHEGITPLSEISGLLGLTIGAATFTGSLIASGKLIGWLRSTPVRLPLHGLVTAALAVSVLVCGALAFSVQGGCLLAALIGLLLLSGVFGWVFSIRIGGADMPVLISFLNAAAGFAAAFCGVILGSYLLVACGAVVASSGSILTLIMCRAMNRHLWQVFLGFQPASTQKPAGEQEKKEKETQEPESESEASLTEKVSGVEIADPVQGAAEKLRQARSVIIIPGYGMAVSQAQTEIVRLAGWLGEHGAEVLFAIHPVAGRMPGHMNVLLAEADVDYDLLKEMEEINPRFSECDLALVVGACDVVNPAAIDVSDTPISGMPILRADQARGTIVYNLDEKPGYSGVPNPLYLKEKTLLVLGDAKASLQRTLEALDSGQSLQLSQE